MNRAGLFILACLLGGAGGALGSMIGHAFGGRGLWVGGILGGVFAAALVARLAVWRRWIHGSRFWATTIGMAIGFFLACGIAANTLSSPIGPFLGTLLIGCGALLGARTKRAPDVHDDAA